MKNGVAHKIPYSEASAALLERMRTIHNGALVFPSKYDKPYGEYIFSKITKQVVPGMTDITAHGFRSTFSTWVDEETDFGPDVREVALSHTVGTKAAQAYARGKLLKKRRTMMEFWATYCLTGKIDPRCRSSFVDAAD
jgi:integrase